LIALAGGGVLLGAVVAQVAFGQPLAAFVAGPIVMVLGVAAAPAVVAWLAAAWHYVRRQAPTAAVARVAGWLLIAVATAVGADLLGDRPISIYGPGGSVGAYVRTQLEDRVPLPALQWLAVAATMAAGVGLTLPVTVRASIAVSGWLGRRTAAVARAVIARWNRPRETVVPLTATVPAATAAPPILKIADLVDAEPDGEIPIISHVVPDEPAPLRVVRDEEPAPEPVRSFALPSLDLLADADPFPVHDHESALRERAVLLERTFADFGLVVKVVGIHTGPVITQYEVALETGLRLNKVTALADDLSLNLKVASVRVVAPLPGRNTVGIEVPNEHRQTVRLKELIVSTQAKTAKAKLPIFLGKDVEGRPLAYDLAGMPHLLIAGRTGTGKSVCLNSIILSLLYTRTPDECRMILIDPKKVELSEYGKLPHLMHPVVTDDKKAEAILAWAVDKMEERYEWLRKARVRNVASYNDLGWDEIVRRVDPQTEDDRKAIPRSMPYVVLVIDEVGDLIMRNKKEIEGNIILIAQKSRAAGIHLILATQKPTVDVITGLIKSNLPARICFQVASRSDSAVVLDEKGAEKLLGMGDMLFLQPGTSSIVRAQGAYVSDNEIEKTVADLECDQPNYEAELLNLKAKSDGDAGALGEALRDRDALYEQAIEIVVREQRGSTSLLQRALGIGYGRASRLIDFMAEDGLVGGFNGSNARDVLVTPEEWQTRKRAG
jgi:S-DNA-T family DNA segregation ATPase FtsK/SpoIIIE